jgi:hypothetical protein
MVAGTSWYPLPATFGVSMVSIKLATTDLVYSELHPKRYRDIKDRTGDSYYYTLRGQWMGIFPAPSLSIANGIEVIHSPIMSMGSDTEEPRIKLPLHLAISLWARLIALGETDDSTGETTKRLSEIISDIPNWYDMNSDEADKLIVER